MNVVILSERDWCASGCQIRDALRLKGHKVSLVKARNVNGYDCDYDLWTIGHTKKKLESGIIQIQFNHSKEIQDLINESEVVLFKGDEPPVRLWHGYNIPERVKIAIVTSGSFFRRKALVPIAAMAKWEFEEYDIADFKFANTPEMAYPKVGFRYLPMAFDSLNKPNLFEIEARHNKRITIMHSPSTRAKKGTDIFIKAIDILRQRGYEFDVKIIENLPVEECIRVKSGATIFYDQNKVGFYGNSGIEAMQYGIPTAAWISDEAYSQSCGLVDEETCPIINTGTSVISMVRAFQYYIGNPEMLLPLSIRTKKYCDDLHSYEATIDIWDREICQKI